MIALKKERRKNNKMKMSKKLLIPAILIGVMAIGTVYGAFLTYKAYVEIYGYKYPLGQIEIETWQMPDIEGLEAREDYVGEMRVYTYSDDAQLVVQLLDVSHIVTNFRCFTVKVCLPLDMVFVVDLTGSMIPYMDAVKDKLLDLMWTIRGMHKCDLQVGVVGFKDYPEDTINMSLTDDLPAVEEYIKDLEAETGGPIPQSHYLGFEKALELFQEKEDWCTHDNIVVFVSDAPPGFDNEFKWWPGEECFERTTSAVRALEVNGIKVHAVLCGLYTHEEWLIYKWYADVTGGHLVIGPERIVPVVTSNPTWIVKLTAVTQFDSFQLPKRSSPPTEKAGFYNFSIYVNFFAKAIPWHEWFTVELAAHLEKAEPKPPFPPPEFPEEERLKIAISLSSDPAAMAEMCTDVRFDYEITETPPDKTDPQKVTLEIVGEAPPLYEGDTFPADFIGFAYWHAHTAGDYTAKVTYEYMYLGEGPFYATATHTLTVT